MNDFRKYRDIVESGSIISEEQSLEEYIISQSEESLIVIIESLTEDEISKIDAYLDEETIAEAPGFGAGLSKAKNIAKDAWKGAKSAAKKVGDTASDAALGIGKISGEMQGAKRVRKFGRQFLKWTRAKGIKQANGRDYAEFLKTELDFNDEEISKAFELSRVKPNAIQAIGRQKLELLAKGTGAILDSPTRRAADADVGGDAGGDAGRVGGEEPSPRASRGGPKPGAGGRVVTDAQMLDMLRRESVSVRKVQALKAQIQSGVVKFSDVSADTRLRKLAIQVGMAYLYLS